MLTPQKEAMEERDKSHDTTCIPYPVRENQNYFHISVCIPSFPEK